jgi:hypothetical protein
VELVVKLRWRWADPIVRWAGAEDVRIALLLMMKPSEEAAAEHMWLPVADDLVRELSEPVVLSVAFCRVAPPCVWSVIFELPCPCWAVERVGCRFLFADSSARVIYSSVSKEILLYDAISEHLAGCL